MGFDDARKFAQGLGLKSSTEWYRYWKSNEQPKNVSSRPDHVYKNKGWNGWGDFLGSGRTRDFRSFEDARKFSQSLELKSSTEWITYCKLGKKPDDIPTTPSKTYKKDWVSWGDWLGTGKATSISFVEARKFVHALGLKSVTEWNKYCNSNEQSNDISSRPDYVYKNKGWVSWGNWLGTGRIATKVQSLQWLPFEDAKKIIHELAQKYNLKNFSDWNEFVKSGKLPKNIPTNPATAYSKKRKK